MLLNFASVIAILALNQKRMSTKNTKPQKNQKPNKPFSSSRSSKRAARKKSKANRPMTFWRYFWRWVRRFLLLAFLVAIVGGSIYILILDQRISSQFSGDKWPEPSRLYARPLELFVGAELQPNDIAAELKRLGYTQSERVQAAGEWRIAGSKMYIGKRPFKFSDGEEPYQRLEIQFADGRISAVMDYDSRESVVIARLDPLMIGSVYPRGGEDRILVKLDEVPPILVDTLIAVEDRKFWEHAGIDYRGILRAVVTNLRERELRQGGSTLTQQLVKNYFLSSERSIRRKAEEAVMAWRLESQATKKEIMQAYLNEVFLSQDGDRAVHGFGLASHYFFGKPLSELQDHHIALLVGMVKGPSAYNPVRKPKQAKKRRNVVISVMVQQELITKEAGEVLRLQDLGVLPKPQIGTSRYPAFTELVKDQLKRDYNADDLNSEGLIIFTTLDTRTQEIAEKALQDHLQAKSEDSKTALQGAAVMVDVHNGEVSAVVGDRDVRNVGFNRALNARRQIGSLIKPLIYLAAMKNSTRYTLATPLDDSPIEIPRQGQAPWKPRNYTGKFVGEVPLYRALAQSYNIPAIRVGMDVGADAVNQVIADLTTPPFADQKPIAKLSSTQPSGYLGAVEMSPYQVAQIYNSLASGGFVTPLNSIRNVLTSDHQLLDRYPLEIDSRVDEKSVFLINQAMQKVTQIGSARSLTWRLPNIGAAGKTGTTNSTRDSWFAGFTGDKLGVVWVGNDKNASTGLTGSSGALPIWANVMKKVANESYDGNPPEGVMEVAIEPNSGLRWGDGCGESLVLPFVQGSEPAELAPCAYYFPTPDDSWKTTAPPPSLPPKSTAPWWETIFD